MALTPGQPVSSETLIDRVWGADPPRNASHSLHTHVSALRRELARGEDDPRAARLRRVGSGYRLEIGFDQVDLHRARRLAAAARSIENNGADRDGQMVALLREAYSLWRGDPLAGVSGEWAERVRRGLEHERLALAVELFKAELGVGKYQAVIGPLGALLADYPLSEPLAALQMLALYRCGRTADALEVYAQTRRRLVDELGDGPGKELRRLHGQVLRRDPSLDRDAPPELSGAGQSASGAMTARRPAAAEAGPSVVPAQLPTDVVAFTGRGQELAVLDRLLPVAHADARRLTVAALDGPAGVGKTALAVHWAQRSRGQFPDGQLYADLRGHAQGEPVAPAVTLSQFLHALGVPVDQVPADVAEAAAMYRSLLADKRVLILLDNAAGAEQVRLLLPAGEGNRVLVTSRAQLTGLVAREGAIRVYVDVLPATDAQALVTGHLKTGRVEATPEQVMELAHLCGCLPLAMRIAAANVITHPQRGIGDILDQLRGKDRLSVLAVPGDPASSVANAFELSYARIPDECRRMFRMLGLVPLPDVTVEAAANLAGIPVAEAASALETLAGANLVEERTAGRYACHDLLWRYAADLLERARDGEVQGARDRLFGYYLCAADAAARAAYPQALRMAREPLASIPVATPPVEGPVDALQWLESERANLVAAVRHAEDRGWHYWAWSIADSLRGYFWIRMHAAEWKCTAQAALRSALAAGNLQAQAAATLSLGSLYGRQRYHQKASEHGHRALALAQRAGWENGDAAALGNLGIIYAARGEPEQAVDYLRRALATYERTGSQYGVASALTNLGSTYIEMGQLTLAAKCGEQALELNTKLGSSNGRAVNLINLGTLHFLAGRLDMGRVDLQEAQQLSESIGSASGLCVSHRWLARVDLVAGRLDSAERLATSAITIARHSGYLLYEADLLNVLASVHQRRERHHQALDCYHQAIALAEQAEHQNPRSGTEAHLGIAAAHLSLGNPQQAYPHLERALVVSRQAPFHMIEAEALTSLAEYYLATGSVDLAMEHARRASALHHDLGCPQGEARSRAVLGRAHQASGDLTIAEQNRQRAHKLLVKVGSSEAEAAAALLAHRSCDESTSMACAAEFDR